MQHIIMRCVIMRSVGQVCGREHDAVLRVAEFLAERFPGGRKLDSQGGQMRYQVHARTAYEECVGA